MNAISQAIAIWKAGVAAVDPGRLVQNHLGYYYAKYHQELLNAPRIIVVGGGKAGAGMAAGVEGGLNRLSKKLVGIVNVPEGSGANVVHIRLLNARPARSNYPTESGVIGANSMLCYLAEAGPDDIAICLISGGGSALMPAPVAGVSLPDKLEVTQQLHACGATIGEMNCVRKHLSRIKGGRLAESFRGKLLISLIVSDVIGDALDIIASGPTAPDFTTFADAVQVLNRYGLYSSVPNTIIDYFERGARGEVSETPKQLSTSIINDIIGSNAVALSASRRESECRNYQIHDLGSAIDGEVKIAALRISQLLRGILQYPAAILFGGETTVALGPNPGKGGRNQEFVLAMLCELGIDGMKGVTILSGGTDGEDGPTDAAGAIGTEETLLRAKALNLDPKDYLDRHDAYHFFEATGGLFKTGLTGTNVMDLGVILLN